MSSSAVPIVLYPLPFHPRFCSKLYYPAYSVATKEKPSYLVTLVCEILPMLDLAKVQCADFAPCVNQDFEIATSGAPLVLQLFEARAREATGRRDARSIHADLSRSAGAAFAPGHLQDEQRHAR